MVISNGIHTDISIKDYHANKSHVSATSIKLAKSSLSLWKYMQTHPADWKQHFDLGNAFELALFDKKAFEEEVAIEQTEAWAAMANEGREKPYSVVKSSAKYKGEESKFNALNEGKYIIPDVGKQSFSVIEKMLESCHRDEVIQKLISGTEYQLSLFWQDEATGLNLKTRPDICKRKANVIVNLKTMADGSPESFSRELAKWDYPMQACVEIKGCLATGLMPQVDFYYWLVVEKEPPFNATIYEFSQEDQKWCFDELAFVLRKMKQAQDEGVYPGYTDRADNRHGILTAKIPLYYKTVFN